LLQPVYQSLGLTVDVVLSYLSDEERRDAYTKQVVYGTLREFGFDFLRDNLKMSPDDLVQKKLNVAIVDEVDHALIDEASTPMIIGGTPTGTGRTLARVRSSVRDLVARQKVVALGLAEQLDGVDCNASDHHTLLAKLMLGQPDHPSLKQHLADNPVQYKRARRLAEQEQADYTNSLLVTGLLYIIDQQDRFVTLTEAGQELLEARLGKFFDAGSLEQRISSVTRDPNIPLAERRQAQAKLTRQLLQRYSLGNQVYQMLRAYLLLKKDADYLVTEDTVVLIDRCTGRPRPDSRYQLGLQAALEAKEGVTVHPDAEVLAQISVQGYVSQYWKLSGMTGTALTSRDEFLEMYGLDVQVVPPTQPSIRVDLGHRVYADRDHKLAAVVDEVEACRRVGRPVLVATLTVEQSEEVSHLLTGRGVPHNLLNAVSGHDEARIVKEAGSYGAVTVATNMAGRGTDIILEQNLSGQVAGRYRDLVQQLLSEDSSSVTLNCYTRGEADILWDELSRDGTFIVTQVHQDNLERIRVTLSQPPQGDRNPTFLDFGLGLYVMGIELSQSARIDLQLKGRSGRQGEFGLTRFFLSLEDQFFVHWAAGVVFPPRGRKKDPAGRDFFEGEEVARVLEEAQGIIDGESEALRRYIRDYGGVLDAHTRLYYRARRGVMASPSFRDEPLRMARSNARYLVHHYFPEEMVADYGLKFDQMAEALQEDYGIDCSGVRGRDRDSLVESIGDLLVARLEEAESGFGGEGFGELGKHLFLHIGDELWTDHFSHLQELMSSIQHDFRSHQAALSQYVLQAFEEQRAFRHHLISSFLSRLARFPTAGVPAQPTVKGHLLEGDLAHDVALVLV
jgi:preprotein translocase subunit SecA